MMNILFWSGGKDSFLALHYYQESNSKEPLKLLTTYNEEKNWIPQQNLPIKTVERQARFLGLEMIHVPLPPNRPNKVYLKRVDEALSRQIESIDNLLFGDWYLQDIRNWREQQFGGLGYSCRFPIWQRSLDELLRILSQKRAAIRISAAAKEYQNDLQIGELYNRQFVRQLPGRIDPMGEKGEFHTEVLFEPNPQIYQP
jgi:diphthamide synthase (EF-2-diphthine--ammonia ligase)